MRKFALAIGIILTFITTQVSPVELKETPLQSQLLQNIARLVSDNFNDFGQEASSKTENWSDRGIEGNTKKSTAKAAIYSAILPGWGEYYVGHKSKARFFFTVEALSWISYAAFTTYGHWKKDDLIRFANEHAGADLWGKDDDFLDMVGFYDDIYEYNSLGRAFDPHRTYLEDNTTNHWRWQSLNDQRIYRHLKNQSREAFRKADFMIGLAILNRVVSVIDAVRDARRSQRTLDDSFGIAKNIRYRFEVNPFSDFRQVSFTVFTPF